MKRALRLAGVLSLGAAMTASGCYVRAGAPPPAYPDSAPAADATTYPTSPPPDPIPEYQPPAPGYGYSWINGYWDWSGYDWTWDAGYWAPQEAGYLYVGPRFVFLDGRPVFYRSYWQGPGGYRSFGYGYRGRSPGVAFQARVTVAPGVWRSQHNDGWRRSPGAGAWRGAPAGGGPIRRGEPVRAEPMRSAPARAAAPMRSAPTRSAPVRAGGGMRRRR